MGRPIIQLTDAQEDSILKAHGWGKYGYYGPRPARSRTREAYSPSRGEWLQVGTVYDCGPDHDCPQNRAKLENIADKHAAHTGRWCKIHTRKVADEAQYSRGQLANERLERTVQDKQFKLLLELRDRVDSLEVMLARAHVVEAPDSQWVETISYLGTSIGWKTVVDTTRVLHSHWEWHHFTRYEISFEPED